MANIGTSIDRAVEALGRGELIGLPTETVYGLAGNALDESALVKIFETKNRPRFDPLITHMDSLVKAELLVQEFPEKAIMLAERFWPGPLTLLLNKRPEIPDLLTAGLPRMALRIPNHPLALRLLSRLDFPLAAPSANPFGFVSPTSARHVDDQLGDKINYVLDGGDCEVGLESTVVGFDDENITIHRLGGLTVEEIEDVVGHVSISLNKSSNPVSPGQTKRHYSPGKPLIIGNITEELQKANGQKVGVISFDTDHGVDDQIVLSPGGNMDEAARRIFSALRTMKNTDVEIIITQKFPESGLGRAINDRLERAAAR